jgi:hypothetical protein
VALEDGRAVVGDAEGEDDCDPLDALFVGGDWSAVSRSHSEDSLSSHPAATAVTTSRMITATATTGPRNDPLFTPPF